MKITGFIQWILSGALLMSYSAIALSDDYRWVQYPQDEESQLIPVDPSICKLYEKNLRYFARKNTPMSCERPIAPQFRDRIKDVEWEDIDPEQYPELLRAIVYKNPNSLNGKSEDMIQHDLEIIKREIRTGVKVFRRAKLSLNGRLDIHQPNAPIEPYWVVQYGSNVISTKNPDGFSQCVPRRGGLGLQYSVWLYVVSGNSLKLIEAIGNPRNFSNEGQHLKLIDGKVFVENILLSGLVQLDQVDEINLMTDTVCNFEFKKSPSRSK